MSKRVSLSHEQVLAVMRLMADVAAHRGQAAVQRRLLIQGMADLVGSPAGFCFVCDGWKSHLQPRMLGSVLLAENSEVFNSYVRDLVVPHGPRADPYCAHALGRTATVDQLFQQDVTDELATVPGDLGPFHEWGFMQRLRDGAVNWARLDHARDGAMVGFALHRLDTDRPFAQKQRALMRLATRELHRLAVKGWFSLPELIDEPGPEVRGLPPRLQQLLSLLLTGRHAKGIAHDLGLSIHTTRGYIKDLYRRLDVSSREELMVKFMSQRPGDA